jgi:hypothetical protein
MNRKTPSFNQDLSNMFEDTVLPRSRPSQAVLSTDNSYMFYLSQWAVNTSSFRNLLNTSKGRDKFCQMLQYTANFYVTCMKES